MALFDMPLAELERYLPAREEPNDFDEFWSDTLERQDANHPLEIGLERVDHGLRLIETHDVVFTGHGGQRIHAWLHRPAGSEPVGVAVGFVGYGGGRGLSHSRTLLAQAGHAVLIMDNRGQGSHHVVGHTGDDGPSGPAAAGFVTRGIETPETYYFTRLFTDAVRAVETARRLPGIDGNRVMVEGGSQGGASALAAAALSEMRGAPVLGAMVNVPFLSHVRRAVDLVDSEPYSELVTYLHSHRDAVDTAFRTISYVDGVNLAARSTAPAWFSVGLRDGICPPSTVYAAYNHYAGPKEMTVYPFNGHEHGEQFREADLVTFARRVLG